MAARKRRLRYCPKSPMTIQIDRLVGEALTLWNEGKRHAAALTLRRALEVAMSNDECRQAFVRHADSIPAQLAQKAPTARPIWEPIVIWGAWPAGFFLGGALFEITGIDSMLGIGSLGGLVVAIWAWVKRTKPLPLENEQSSQKPSGQRKSKDSSRKKSKGGPSRGIPVKKKGGGS